jgi:hypothetical protein
MKSVVPLIISSIIFLSCSQTYHRDISDEERNQHLNIFDELDSTMVKGAIKPFEYQWNTEGNLVDLVRQRYIASSTDANYPNPFSPPTNIPIVIHNSDTIMLYLCNTNESSCIKLFEEHLEKGLYSYGFQKLELKTGKYVVKILSKYSTYLKGEITLP